MTNTIPQAQWDYLQDRVNQMKVRDKAVKKLFYSGVARGLGGAVAGVGGAVLADYAIDYFTRNPDDEYQDITSVAATVLVGSEQIWVPSDYESEPFTPPVPPAPPPPWKANDFNELLNWLSDDKNDAMRKNFVDKIADDLIDAYEDAVKEVLEDEGFEDVQKPDFSGMKDNLKNSGMLGAVPAMAGGSRSPQTPGGQRAQDKADTAKREEEKINVEKEKVEEQKKTNQILEAQNDCDKLGVIADILSLIKDGIDLIAGALDTEQQENQCITKQDLIDVLSLFFKHDDLSKLFDRYFLERTAKSNGSDIVNSYFVRASGDDNNLLFKNLSEVLQDITIFDNGEWLDIPPPEEV